MLYNNLNNDKNVHYTQRLQSQPIKKNRNYSRAATLYI